VFRKPFYRFNKSRDQIVPFAKVHIDAGKRIAHYVSFRNGTVVRANQEGTKYSSSDNDKNQHTPHV
jgi:hypothetical protein